MNVHKGKRPLILNQFTHPGKEGSGVFNQLQSPEADRIFCDTSFESFQITLDDDRVRRFRRAAVL